MEEMRQQITARAKQKLENEFDQVIPVNRCFIVITKDKKYGFALPGGRLQLEPIYDKITYIVDTADRINTGIDYSAMIVKKGDKYALGNYRGGLSDFDFEKMGEFVKVKGVRYGMLADVKYKGKNCYVNSAHGTFYDEGYQEVLPATEIYEGRTCVLQDKYWSVITVAANKKEKYGQLMDTKDEAVKIMHLLPPLKLE